MGQVKTEKTFYRNFFSIYIVLVLQNVVTISVNLADNVMLGGYSETAIIREGASYLRIVRFTYFFFAVTTILLATLRSVETVKIAFALSVMAFFVNCCINYVLIYGKFGAPEMGAEGAAIGMLAARILEGASFCATLPGKKTGSI